MSEEPFTTSAARREPSVSGSEEFLSLGDRKTHLEQLRHLSQWSRRVLLVTGPRGVGKSTLYRQLSASLEPRAKAARINGALVSGSREVLNAMVQGFGLAAPATADTQLLHDLVSEHADAQQRSERFCVVLIDDAELLEAKALEQLLSLSSEATLRVVLFGEIRLVPAVERAADSVGAAWHEIRLTGLAPGDVRTYLEWRLRRQGHTEPMPFTDGQVKEIARLSEGLPGRIDQMSNVLLAKIRSGGDVTPRRRFPALHQALLAVLVVAVAFAYLVWQPADDSGATRWAEVERIEVPPRPVESVPDVATVTPRQPDARAAGETAAAPETDAGAADAKPGAPPAEAPGTQSEAAAVRPAPADAAPTEESATEPPEEAAGADAATAEESPAPAEPEAADAPESPAAEPSAAEGGRDAAWILRQPEGNFTLQLVSFSTAERASAYVAAQPDPASFARYRLQRNGTILHVVIYGRFNSRGAAEEAATGLPASAGNVEPWIRSYGQVQDAVRTALQTQ